MSDITSQEVLELFTQAAAVNNSDQFLLHAANLGSGNKAVKVTAEVVRAYLLRKIAITIEADGYIYIGGENTGFKAEGVTPQLERRTDGIYCSTDNGETWTCIAYYSDFGYTPVVYQTETTGVTIMPERLNKWQTPVSPLTVYFGPGASGSAGEYMLEFTVGSDNFTLSLPNGIRWSEEPEWVNGNTYQVSVMGNLALYAEWEAANS